MLLKRPKTMVRWLSRFLRDESGPTATEYAVMLALIVLVSVGVIGLIGKDFNNLYVIINEAIPDPA